MSADVAGWINAYGLPLVFVTAYLSCLAMPVPASLVFMAAGTFAASGELDFLALWLTGYAGAVAGDQSGFHLARWFAGRYHPKKPHPRWQKGLDEARNFSEKWGGLSVFLSRWLASPLGPWVNFSSGITGYSWPAFTIAGAAGEAIWITLYVGLGFAFSGQVQAIADLIGNAVWLIIAATLTLVLGRRLAAAGRQRRQMSSDSAGQKRALD